MIVETDYGMEINATRGCTNSCNHCNHSSTRFTESYYMSPETLKADLDVMKDLIRTKLLFVQGGEPLLHPKVVELMSLCYDSGIAKQCGVLTNGKLLPRMGDDFWEMLATRKMELRLSCYPDLSPDIVPFVQDKAQQWGFFVRPQTINSFKPLFLKNDGSTYYGCPWSRCLTLHEHFFYLCPLTTFFPKQHMGLPEHIDGISLDGLDEPKLREFLNRSHPLETCKICAGGRGEDIPWSQAKTKQEWFQTAGMTPELSA